MRDEVHRAEPHRQGQLGGVEDRTSRRRRLMVTGVALEQAPLADDAICTSIAAWAAETIGPTPSRDERAALLLVRRADIARVEAISDDTKAFRLAPDEAVIYLNRADSSLAIEGNKNALADV